VVLSEDRVELQRSLSAKCWAMVVPANFSAGSLAKNTTELRGR
jgi:hypothetical protein